ncbi:MAG: D-alanyl-D-alanine carboxypeptidase family protein [Gammaproteobacteria bacterium]
MRRSALVVLGAALLAVLTLFATPLIAQQQPAAPAAPAASQQPPPELPVRGYVLIDFHSGRTLVDKNSESRMEPASITKLMTGYVIYKRLAEGKLKLTDQIAVSDNARKAEGSRMFVETGDKVAVEDLLMGMVVQSGNDATIALAEHIAGSEASFVTMMNQYATELGLTNTHYMNVTGLPHPDHYTTARDIATLARAIIKDFPDHYVRYSVKSFKYNKIEQPNRNKLLWRDPSVDGIKTGHTASAGFCLASSAKRGDMRLIAVVLGAKVEEERFKASQELLEYGFRVFETHKLYDANHAVTEARVWKGDASKLPLGFLNSVFVTIPKGRYQDLNASLQVDTAIEAPVHKGARFGNVNITLDGTAVTDLPLVALQDVAEAGLLGRLTDDVLLMIYSLFD